MSNVIDSEQDLLENKEKELIPQITEEEIALLLEHEEITPELQALIQQYQEAKASHTYPIGSHCAITFSFEHYDLLLLPAIILSYSSTAAQVLILTPVTLDSVPCPKYFGNNKQCTQCQYSHGYNIPIDQILPYEALEKTQVDHLQYGKKVWCKTSGNDIWKLGNIIDQLHGPRWRVRLKGKGRKRITVDLEHIKPFQSLDDDNSQDDEKDEWSESDNSGQEYVDDISSIQIPNITRSWGTWQNHTTGFGFKMMKKMGYVEGNGLGLDGKGRVDPIEAHLSHRDTNSRPGLGLEKKGKKKAKDRNKSSVPEDEQDQKDTVIDLIHSLVDTDKVVGKDKTAREKEPIKVKIDVANKQQANKTLAKLQSDLDKAQKEYMHAKEAHRRNRGTPLENQFTVKLKSATTQLDNAKKQFNQISNHVKQEKERKDMYTF